MPIFVPHGPLVPDELVQDLEDDRVVLFCGAGISMGAGLPDYNGLVRSAYEEMGVPAPPKRDRQWLWPDRLVGDLEARTQPGAVRTAVAEALSKPPTSLDLHQALLRLAKLRQHDGLRLVTTNFDTYFEAADPALKDGIDLHSGPILPIPRDDRGASWRSVVYLHGRLRPAKASNDHLVLTSADFGRAYLTDQWAARFVARLFADFSVLFVGYSLNDPVLRYMTDAFAAEALVTRRRTAGPQAYILVPYKGKKAPAEDEQQDWRRRGLEPIFYHHRGRHRLLRETLVAWADARDDWLSSTATLVARLAGTPPASSTPSDVTNLLWVLFGRFRDDGYGAKVFADLDPSPTIEWLQVFEKRETDLADDFAKERERAQLAGEPDPPEPQFHLRLLSVSSDRSNPPLTAVAFQLCRWLAGKLSDDVFVDWTMSKATRGLRLHPRLRWQIRAALKDTSLTLSPPRRRFWRLVSTEAAYTSPQGSAEAAWDFAALLSDTDAELDLSRTELLSLLRPYISLSPSTARVDWGRLLGEEEGADPEFPEDRFSRYASAEVKLTAGDALSFVLESFNALPDAGARWALMTDDLTSSLKEALDLWTLVDMAGVDGDPGAYHQPSIVPHQQNHRLHSWTLLIDVLVQGWSHLDTANCGASRRLVERWRSLDHYPTFGRLVLAALTRSKCWTAEEKLEALLHGLK